MQWGGNTNFPGRRPKGLLCVTCGTLPALFGTLRYPKFTPYFPFFLFSPLCKVHFSYGIIPGEFWDQPGSVQSQRNHPAEISAMARGMQSPGHCVTHLEIPNNWIFPKRWTWKMNLSQLHHGHGLCSSPHDQIPHGWRVMGTSAAPISPFVSQKHGWGIPLDLWKCLELPINTLIPSFPKYLSLKLYSGKKGFSGHLPWSTSTPLSAQPREIPCSLQTSWTSLISSYPM